MYKPIYFKLDEFIKSETAKKHGIDNFPNFEEVENLSKLCKHLDNIRSLFGAPIEINSGFRTKALNSLLSGSSSTSFHLRGLAADIRGRCPIARLRDVIFQYCGFVFKSGVKHYEDDSFEVIIYDSFIHFAVKINVLS